MTIIQGLVGPKVNLRFVGGKADGKLVNIPALLYLCFKNDEV